MLQLVAVGFKRPGLVASAPNYDINPIPQGRAVIPAQLLWMLHQQANFQRQLQREFSDRERDSQQQQLQRESKFSDRG